METVTVERAIDADPEEVRAALGDIGPFMRASGFDDVTVDGDRVSIANNVGLATIELELAVVDDPDADLAYEQREGIFDEMVTRYVVEERPGGATVTATTEYAVKARLVGPLLDATVVARQRRIELEDQFDYLEERLA